jgi:RNA polymerase sigma factor (TIGR02999 family)
MIASVEPGRFQSLLLAAQRGDGHAREQIAAWMLSTAERHASRVLRHSTNSVAPSSLVSHVLVRLFRGDSIDRAPDIYYLIACITNATRQLIIDHYRRVECRRRHATLSPPATLPWFQQVLFEQHIDTMELETALEELQAIHPRKASVVNLRFFCELSTQEVAEALGISKSTVESDLRLARGWLYRRLGGSNA